MQTPIASVLAIIPNNKGEVLFVKQKTGPYKGWWLLPGGHVKFGETSRDAIVREVEEETGLVVKVSKLLGVFDVIDTKQNFHFIHAVFLCEPIGGKLKAGSDASEIKWFNPNMLDKAQTDLKRILKETGFIKN
ncbi:MAG: NUDIX hydrolase [Candidatus Bathyarchaeota archaeon]|nr:NUDIX hydrolase [Candidatus Bathyarchaeota archaeon]